MTRTLTLDTLAAATEPYTPVRASFVRKKRLWHRRRWVIAASVVLILAAVAMGVLLRLWSSTPNYWAANQAMLRQTDPATMRQQADEAYSRWVAQWSLPAAYETQQDMLAQLSANGQADLITNDTRTLIMSLDTLNMFLASHPQLLKNLPDGIESVMVSQRAGKPVLAARIKKGGLDQVFSFVLGYEIRPDAPARFWVEDVYAGNLVLPRDTVKKQLMKIPAVAKSDTLQGYVRCLFTGEPIGDLVLPLDGAHSGRIVALSFDNGEIRMTRRVFANEP